VLLLETPFIFPDNQNPVLLKEYKRIFTWNNDLVDNERYHKLNFPNKIFINPVGDWQNRYKLCCMIAGNKTVKKDSPLELYSERVKTIRWFEKNAPQDFDLYGIGWDKPVARKTLLGKVFRRLESLISQQVFFPSYRGKVVSKLETLQHYRFTICYENVRDITGYITEKIFDSFFAGCIPVYWGEKNIQHFIPHDCFIDRRDFPTHEALYAFMMALTEPDYRAYQQRMAAFLQSEAVYSFSAEYFVETLVKTIVQDFDC
jgi:alpha(1,3/1,4) fucosyltransferase